MPEQRIHLLFVCGRAKWRSPTAERVFSRDPRYGCRARGLSKQARRTLTVADIAWADVIFVMERKHAERLRETHRERLGRTPVYVLDIPDEYEFMSPDLIELLETRVPAYLDASD